MKSLVQKVNLRFNEFAKEYRLRHLSYGGQVLAWIRNRNLSYQLIDLESMKQRSRSDTLFILGSGPSLLRLSQEQLSVVAKHDSFGINFSFLIDFVPTYHILHVGHSEWHRRHFSRVLAPKRQLLSPTIWFISNRHTRRLFHPRYTPEFFPEQPKVCIFTQPPFIILDRDRPFTAEDFEQTVFYRGTLSLVLHLALQLSYSRIVLIGVDLDSPGHFFDNMPVMQDYLKHSDEYRKQRYGERAYSDYESMLPDGNKFRPFDEYLYAFNRLFLNPRGVELFIGSTDNILYPKISCFQWDNTGSLS